MPIPCLYHTILPYRVIHSHTERRHKPSLPPTKIVYIQACAYNAANIARIFALAVRPIHATWRQRQSIVTTHEAASQSQVDDRNSKNNPNKRHCEELPCKNRIIWPWPKSNVVTCHTRHTHLRRDDASLDHNKIYQGTSYANVMFKYINSSFARAMLSFAVQLSATVYGAKNAPRRRCVVPSRDASFTHCTSQKIWMI
jgi:hypothetical protein